MADRIVDIIGKIHHQQQFFIRCYEWFHTSNSHNCITRSIYHNLAEVQISYNYLISLPITRLGTVLAHTSKIPDRFVTRHIVTSSRCATPSVGTACQYTLPEKLQLFIKALKDLTVQMDILFPYLLMDPSLLGTVVQMRY